jgi:putative transposase
VGLSIVFWYTAQFWSDGGYIGTVGDGVTSDIMKDYVEKQGTILKMVDNKIYILCKIFESFIGTLGVYNDSNRVYY